MQNKNDNLIIEMKDISKFFPGTRALDHVSLKLRKGEIHALVGENGAGKSTLMNILTGQLTKDGGEVFMEGEPLRLSFLFLVNGFGKNAQNIFQLTYFLTRPAPLSVFQFSKNRARSFRFAGQFFRRQYANQIFKLFRRQTAEKTDGSVLNAQQTAVSPGNIHYMPVMFSANIARHSAKQKQNYAEKFNIKRRRKAKRQTQSRQTGYPAACRKNQISFHGCKYFCMNRNILA